MIGLGFLKLSWRKNEEPECGEGSISRSPVRGGWRGVYKIWIKNGKVERGEGFRKLSIPLSGVEGRPEGFDDCDAFCDDQLQAKSLVYSALP